jgi:hypothetical protein
MNRIPEHIWFTTSGAYASANIRYTWSGVLPYQKKLKRPGFPTFPAVCVPAWLWTPYAAMVWGACVFQSVSHWARYFRARVLARWIGCQPSKVRGVIVGRLEDLKPRQMELPLAG